MRDLVCLCEDGNTHTRSDVRRQVAAAAGGTDPAEVPVATAAAPLGAAAVPTQTLGEHG